MQIRIGADGPVLRGLINTPWAHAGFELALIPWLSS